MGARWQAWRAAAALAFLSLAGCGGNKPPEPVDVQGRVIGADGKPPPPLVLTLLPLDEVNKHIQVPVAVTKADGRFVVRCPPGRYRIKAAGLPAHQGGPPSAGPTGIPGAPPDAGPLGGPWELQVRESGNPELIINLTGFGPAGRK
jgi:hypothetical protein